MTASDPDDIVIIVTDLGDAGLHRAATEAGAIACVHRDNLMAILEIID